MLTRIISAVVGLAIVVPTLVFGGHLGAELLVAFVALVGLDEWTRMATPERNYPALAVLAPAGIGLYAAMVWGPATWHVPVLAAGTLAILVFSLLTVPDTAKGQQTAVRLVAGLVYVPVFLAFVPLIRAFDNGMNWIFLLITVTWLGDSGAYFAGRALGKHKLFERVSPKKTWEGAIGGVVTSVVGAVLIQQFLMPELPLAHAIAIGIVGDAMGVVGDLVESMWKRSFGVKDSGWIMPGHGGILDRVDSLLFTAPTVYLYALAFGLG